MPSDGPIIVSQGAYACLKVLVADTIKLKRDWVSFPEAERVPCNKKAWYNYIQELSRQKKVLEERGATGSKEFRMLVEFDEIIQSKRSPFKRRKSVVEIPTPAIFDENNQPIKVTNNPVSFGGHLMTFSVLESFVKEVREFSIMRNEDRFKENNAKMRDLKQRFVQAEGDQHRLILNEISKLDLEMRHQTSECLLESLKETVADKRFSRFNWDWLSQVAVDYISESFAGQT